MIGTCARGRRWFRVLRDHTHTHLPTLGGESGSTHHPLSTVPAEPPCVCDNFVPICIR